MKQFIIVCALLSVVTQTLSAQDSVLLKRYFIVNLTLLNGEIKKGYLSVLSDSSVGVSHSPVTIRVENSSPFPYQKINYSDIQEMNVHRHSSVGRGIFYGSMIGMVTGILTGLALGSDPDQTYLWPDFFGTGSFTFTMKGITAGEKAVAGAFLGGLGGAVIGGVVGALAHKTFIIGGKKKQFTEMRGSLISRVYSTTGE